MGGLISRLTQDKSSSCERAQQDQSLSKIAFQERFFSLGCPLECQIKHWDLILISFKIVPLSSIGSDFGISLGRLRNDWHGSGMTYGLTLPLSPGTSEIQNLFNCRKAFAPLMLTLDFSDEKCGARVRHNHPLSMVGCLFKCFTTGPNEVQSCN